MDVVTLERNRAYSTFIKKARQVLPFLSDFNYVKNCPHKI